MVAPEPKHLLGNKLKDCQRFCWHFVKTEREWRERERWMCVWGLVVKMTISIRLSVQAPCTVHTVLKFTILFKNFFCVKEDV